MLLLVALDDVGRARRGGIGLLPCVTPRAPLAQEIPALVERGS